MAAHGIPISATVAQQQQPSAAMAAPEHGPTSPSGTSAAIAPPPPRQQRPAPPRNTQARAHALSRHADPRPSLVTAWPVCRSPCCR